MTGKTGSLAAPALAAALALGAVTPTFAAPATVTFGRPPWPGVTAKTEVVSQVLNAIGYRTRTLSLGTPFVYRGLANGKLDVFMATWLPAQRNMLDPLLKKHQVVRLGTNLSGAIEGLAVPDYVWKQGVHTVRQLAHHGGEFGHTIYGIESGSAINGKIKKAIHKDYEGLGHWKLVASSTAAMLTQVRRATARHRPIVFIGWRPHWMNIKFRMRYLRDKTASPIAGIKSRVFTVSTASLPRRHPAVARFLRQFHVSAATQSRWIYDYSYRKAPKAKVAHRWLAHHPTAVRRWLKGVSAASGGSGYQAFRKAFHLN